MLRIPLVVAALLAGPVLAQPEGDFAPGLVGRVEGRTYISPVGTFRITIPVLPELGGSIKDTGNVVTFQDQFNLHVSIGAFPMDATQRWELSTRGMQDYLGYFLENFVLVDFQHMFPGTRIESRQFVPDLMSGALVAYTLLPGGSMFEAKQILPGADPTPPVAKRGNLLFVRDGCIYIISTELAERVIERSTYHKTTAEENALLRQRLEDIVKKMAFTPRPKDS